MRINKINEWDVGKVKRILYECSNTISYHHPPESYVQKALNSNGKVYSLSFHSLVVEGPTFHKPFLRKFIGRYRQSRINYTI